MSKIFLTVNDLQFTYESLTSNLIENFSIQFGSGWTGIVGANGTGKTTLLKLIAGIIKPDGGNIQLPGAIYYCDQRTEEKPERYLEFLNSFLKRSFRIRDELQIENGWFERWDTLSQGEKRRCQLAVALNFNPVVLAVDEPTNHIDYKTQTAIINTLKKFKGIGLVISHNRELLDEICGYTLIMKPGGFIYRQGAFSEVTDQLEMENDANRHLSESRQKEIRKLEREVKTRHQKANSADAKNTKRNIDKKDHDAKAKMDAARLTGKDATDGKVFNRLNSRLMKMEEMKNSITVESKKELGITIQNSKRANRIVAHLEEGSLPIGEKRKLSFPSFKIEKNYKIGLTGNNGAGKSTFVNFLYSTLKIDRSKFIYLKQEISIKESTEIIENIGKLRNEDKGKIITIIDKLGSDPKRVLEMESPSPGEIRKLILAEGLLKSPELIIMDEPTNHMDIPSIQCLEKALIEVDCALLLVSHDKVFLKNVVNTNWSLENGELKIN